MTKATSKPAPRRSDLGGTMRLGAQLCQLVEDS